MAGVDQHDGLLRLLRHPLQARLQFHVGETLSVDADQRFGAALRPVFLLDCLPSAVARVVDEDLVAAAQFGFERVQCEAHAVQRQFAISQYLDVAGGNAHASRDLGRCRDVVRDALKLGDGPLIVANRHDQGMRRGRLGLGKAAHAGGGDQVAATAAAVVELQQRGAGTRRRLVRRGFLGLGFFNSGCGSLGQPGRGAESKD